MFAVGNGRFMVISEETASSKWDVQKVGRKLFWVDKNSFIEGKKKHRAATEM